VIEDPSDLHIRGREVRGAARYAASFFPGAMSYFEECPCRYAVLDTFAFEVERLREERRRRYGVDARARCYSSVRSASDAASDFRKTCYAPRLI